LAARPGRRNRYRGWALPTTVPCGARTFLAGVPRDRPADRQTRTLMLPHAAGREKGPQRPARPVAVRSHPPQDSGMATVTLYWTAFPPPGFTGGAGTGRDFYRGHLRHHGLLAAPPPRAPPVRAPSAPPPYQVLFPGPVRPPLTTLTDRAGLLHAAGADHVVILRTEPALLALSPEAFFEDILARQLGAKAIAEGYDFRFGRGRAGDTALLRELCAKAGFGFEEVPPVVLGGEPV